MFDISWGEMLVVGVVALLVIGPKELPGVIRAVGRGAGKLRTMAGEFRAQFDDALREAELHEVKKTFDDVKDTATGLTTSTFDPIRNQLNETVESLKADVSQASGVTAMNESISTITADAQALEADALAASASVSEPVPDAVAEPEPEPVVKPKRGKSSPATPA